MKFPSIGIRATHHQFYGLILISFGYFMLLCVLRYLNRCIHPDVWFGLKFSSYYTIFILIMDSDCTGYCISILHDYRNENTVGSGQTFVLVGFDQRAMPISGFGQLHCSIIFICTVSDLSVCLGNILSCFRFAYNCFGFPVFFFLGKSKQLIVLTLILVSMYWFYTYVIWITRT